MAELTAARVNEVSDVLLAIMENALQDLGPAEAATVLCHLAGRLMGKHGERTMGMRVSLTHWNDAWKSPPIQQVFEQGFQLERRTRN